MLQTEPVACAQMLIRKPIAEVFEAFVDPEITSKFWFSRGDRRLEEGKTVTWYWDMYGVTADVKVKSIEQDKRILIEWPTPVEWIFTPRGDDATFVTITASGFEAPMMKGGASDRFDGRLHHHPRWMQGVPGAWHRAQPRSRSQPGPSCLSEV